MLPTVFPLLQLFETKRNKKVAPNAVADLIISASLPYFLASSFIRMRFRGVLPHSVRRSHRFLRKRRSLFCDRNLSTYFCRDSELFHGLAEWFDRGRRWIKEEQYRLRQKVRRTHVALDGSRRESALFASGPVWRLRLAPYGFRLCAGPFGKPDPKS